MRHPLIVLASVVLLQTGHARAAGAAGGGGPPKRPADLKVLATVSITSVAEVLKHAAGLAAKTGLPVDAQGLRESALSALEIPPAVGAKLDLAQPVGIAVVSTGAGAPPAVALAVAAAGPKAAREAVAAFAAGGKSQARWGGAFNDVTTAGGQHMCTYVDGVSIVAGDTCEQVNLAAPAALAARRKTADDVLVVAFPDAIARAQGTEVGPALQALIGEMRAELQQRRGTGKPIPGFDELVMPMAEMLVPRIGDLVSVDLGFKLDETRGLTCALRLRPRPGTPLADSARTVAPFAIDPNVVQGDSGMVFSSGALDLLRQALRQVATAYGKSAQKGAGAMAKGVGAFADNVTGAMSGAWRPGGSFMSYDFVYEMKDAAAGPKLIDAYADMIGSPAFQALMEQSGEGEVKTKMTAKKEKVAGLPGVHVTTKVEIKSKKPEMVKMLKVLYGGDRLESYATASGTKLYLSSGPDAVKRIAAMIKGGGSLPTSGALADALAETRGREGMGYLDLAAVLRPMMAMAPNPQAASMIRPGLQIPLFGSWTGDGRGEQIVFEARVPVAALAAGGQLAAAAMAGGMGM